MKSISIWRRVWLREEGIGCTIDGKKLAYERTASWHLIRTICLLLSGNSQKILEAG